MANRRTLHKTHLQEFKNYLQGRGISYRDGKGSYQVLQVMTLSKGWKCVYERIDMPEHFTIQDDLEPIVMGFYSSRKKEKKSTGSVIDEKQHMLQEIHDYEVENKKQSERIKKLELALREYIKSGNKNFGIDGNKTEAIEFIWKQRTIFKKLLEAK